MTISIFIDIIIIIISKFKLKKKFKMAPVDIVLDAEANYILGKITNSW